MGKKRDDGRQMHISRILAHLTESVSTNVCCSSLLISFGKAASKPSTRDRDISIKFRPTSALPVFVHIEAEMSTCVFVGLRKCQQMQHTCPEGLQGLCLAAVSWDNRCNPQSQRGQSARQERALYTSSPTSLDFKSKLEINTRV